MDDDMIDPGKTMGKPWENHGKTMEKMVIYIVINHWLVVTGTMDFYDFPIILGRIPTDEVHHFPEG